jgi:DNA-binding transcriptional regulator YiaG
MGQNEAQMPRAVERLSPPKGRVKLSTGERIRILRGRARVTRPQLADWAQVSRSSLSRYERSEISPPGDVLGQMGSLRRGLR